MRKRFSEQLERERQRRGWSQQLIAEKLQVDIKTVSRWLNGKSLPQISLHEKIAQFMEMPIEETGLLDDSATSHSPSPSSEDNNEIAFPREKNQEQKPMKDAADSEEAIRSFQEREDWGEAPFTELADFYGREQELTQLRDWIVSSHSRIVALIGAGGVGKSSLTVQLAKQVQDSFRCVFWRSLQDAPPLEHILKQCILFTSLQELTDIPKEIDEQLLLLTRCLRTRRCLIILDNVESIMQAGQRAGIYRDGYENYGRLFQRIAETHHESCLVLTSREMPKEIVLLASDKSPVRLLRLSGIEESEGAKILQERGATGSHMAIANLVASYSGNPLALKIVASSIQSIFSGDIDHFLKAKERVFGDITDLLKQQFSRLSLQEKEIMYWLAIEREPVALADLQADLVSLDSQQSIVGTLDSLRRRSMIEPISHARFTLQPVIMEYVTLSLIQLFFQSFRGENNSPWMHYALLKGRSKNYIRESQSRLMLEPVAQRLREEMGVTGIEQTAHTMLAAQRQLYAPQHGYLASNVLHLLIHLGSDLRSADFSFLPIRQAYLQDVALQHINFSHARFIGSTFMNTFGNVTAVAFNVQRDLLATGTTTGEVWMYTSPDGTPQRPYRGHTDTVWSVAFDRSGQFLTSSSDDRTIRVWEVATGHCLSIFQHHKGRVRGVAFHPYKDILASGDEDRIIYLWERLTGNIIKKLEGHEGRIWSLAFSPDGCLLATGSTDRTIRLWDVDTGACLRVLEGHSGWIRSVTFHPAGALLLSGGDDKTVRLWDVNTGQGLHVLEGHNNHIWSVAFSPDGKQFASAGEDRLLRVWNADTNQYALTLQGHAHGIRSIAFSPNGKWIASGGEDQTARLWDVKTGQSLKILQGYTNRVWSVVFGAEEQTFLSCSEDRCIRLWHVDTPVSARTYQDASHGVRAIAFAPDGQSFASGGEDKTVRLWDINTGRCFRTFAEHTAWIRSIAINADGMFVASGGEDHTVRLWDVSSGQCLHALIGHSNWIRTLAFNPKVPMLASGGDDHTILLWEYTTGHLLHRLSEHKGKVRSVAFNSRGTLLASGGEDRMVRVWDVHSGKCLCVLAGHTNWVHSVAFSPDGRTLASSGDDYTIRLWDVGTEQQIETISGHTNRVRWVTFSPNGHTFLSCSDDGFIQLYDAQTYQRISTFINERPYEKMNILDVKGLTEAQKEALHTLGAIER